MTTRTDQPLVNRVAQSGIITLDLEKYAPDVQFRSFDIAEFLFQGLVLREKDFRASLKDHDWKQYREHVLLVYCSADAVIPKWAYMLVTALALPFATDVFYGHQEQYLEQHFANAIAGIDPSDFTGARVVIKGCSGTEVPVSAYVAIQRRLQPVVRSLMYGEPCSTVPVFKDK